jgi:glycosyltransferase involved in cell wall biosynthesis
MAHRTDACSAVNVCLTHDPVLAGLYRAINDFARALDAPIVSFDDGMRDRNALAAAESVPASRIATGSSWLSRECHWIPHEASVRAEAAMGDADLLLVHSLFRAHAPWGAEMARRHGRRYWVIPHGCLDPWGLGQRRWLKRAWLEAYGRGYFAGAERIVFSTRREADKASRWIPEGRAAVVHWPVELADVANREARRHDFRSKHHIGADQRVLLSVSRLHSMKRSVETVRAFCEAGAPGCVLVIVGMDGDLTAAGVTAAVPESHRHRVRVVGPLFGASLTDAYLAADGYISRSYRENFGYAVAEALGYGLPVIVSPGHDLAYELPRNGDQLACGWLLPDDSEAMALGAINAFSQMSDEDLINRGNVGASWAKDWLSFQRFQDSLRSLADGTWRKQ